MQGICLSERHHCFEAGPVPPPRETSGEDINTERIALSKVKRHGTAPASNKAQLHGKPLPKVCQNGMIKGCHSVTPFLKNVVLPWDGDAAQESLRDVDSHEEPPRHNGLSEQLAK